MQNYFGYGKGKETVHTCPHKSLLQALFLSLWYGNQFIKDCFDREDFKMDALLEQVLLKATKHDEYEEELKEVIQFYKEDFYESLVRLQLLTFSINFQSATKKDANITLPTIWTYLQKFPSGIKLLLSQAIPLAKLVLVTTATKTTSDQSFGAIWQENRTYKVFHVLEVAVKTRSVQVSSNKFW